MTEPEYSEVALRVNSKPVSLAADPDTPLILALRNDLGLKGVRAGCGIGECGACTVIVDGESIRSCITPVSAVAGADITTPEGLGTPDAPHPVQQAFLDEQAAQCGYCINGIIMTVAALTSRAETASQQEFDDALSEHLCRCGTHVRILRAIQRARGSAPTPATEGAGAKRGAGEHGDARASGVPGGCVSEAAACGGACARKEPPAALVANPAIESWLRLLPDGRIEALTGKVEIGQGLRTAMGQIVAAQLNVDVDAIVVSATVTGHSPDERYTAGSMSIEDGGTAQATAAVAFRRVLLERASKKLGAPVAGLGTHGVTNESGDVLLSLVDLAADGPLTGTITTDDQPHWHGLSFGTPAPRADLLTKLTGAAAYVHDMELPDMLHARVLLPPSYGAQLEQLDEDSARSMPGVAAIVRQGRLVMAIAEREEQATKAIARLAGNARWDDPGLDVDGDVASVLRALDAESLTVRGDPGVDKALEESHRTVGATYTRPYHAHAAMAPSCAVASDDGGVLSVWTHSQGVYPLRRELARLFDLEEQQLVVHHRDGPGCYGHNGADDAAAFAAVAARAVPGRPVRFQFTNEDEFTWEPYGSAMVTDLQGSIDDRGCITGWRHQSRTDVHNTRPDGSGDRLIPAWLREPTHPLPWTGPNETGTRDILPLYGLPAVEAVTDFVRGPLRTSALRSLASFHHVFATESFMDELAEAAGSDPVEFRMAHLHDERAKHVLAVAAEAAAWQPHVGPSGRGYGVAVCQYKASKAYVANVVHADIDAETGEITVHRVVLACDAGAIVNPDGLRNQLEGGVVQSVSRTLYEEIRVDRRGIASRDWTTYPVIRFSQIPEVEIILVDHRDYPPLGAGESATPGVAPALAGAIDDRIGVRLRNLPFTPERTRRRLLDLSEEEMERVRLD